VGLSFYTLGQRQGLGIGGVAEGGGAHAPWYVAHKDLAHNTLHVVQGHEHAWLQSQWLEAEDLSWVSGHAPAAAALAAKTRYRQTDAPCALSMSDGVLRLDFATPQWAVTPGQSAVVYEGEVCLGGGVIARAAVPQVTAAGPRPARARHGRRAAPRGPTPLP
jgi:tRNA-specific 2-thiouridylase